MKQTVLRQTRFLWLCWMLLSGVSLFAQVVPLSRPEDVGLDSQHLQRLQGLAEAAIERGDMPGCVIAVARQGRLVHLQAIGNRQVEPSEIPMTTDTVFDLASLTKPLATATAVMQCREQGLLDLDTPVSRYLPEFTGNGKEHQTLRHLLTHQSGLIADNPLSDYRHGPDAAWQAICQLSLKSPPETRFVYSDVNFIVLGKLVERVSGMPLDQFVRQSLFQPLGMQETGFLPDASRRERTAPTEKEQGTWLSGVVHDPRARSLGGVAGHAGLFSTAPDLVRYALAMLDAWKGRETPTVTRFPLGSPSVREMTGNHSVPGGLRGLGWDRLSAFSGNRGNGLSHQAFGHGGFTGTVLWIDPELDLAFVFLSNRLHPDGQGSVNAVAREMMDVVTASLRSPPWPSLDQETRDRLPDVLTGIDVLQQQGFRELQGQRVGLITNHTGRNRLGESTAAVLFAAPEVTLTTLFGPEHGPSGRLDQSAIGDSRDPLTGLPNFSLYGDVKQPTPEMLQQVDTLVFDIQDIGTRFYTYTSTLGLAMRAATRDGKRLVVLDRPNPIGGIAIDGPILEKGAESFVGIHTLPIRHGMTIGELAQMFRSEWQLELDLVVIPCQNWSRNAEWDQTGLTWIDPSPNMRSLNQALLYPGVGILETTNVSVGRGTDTPFERVGAPWINGRQLAQDLNAAHLPGTTFVPIEFSPSASVHRGQRCEGIQILITDRQAFEPLAVGLAIACSLQKHHAAEWDTTSLNRLLGDRTTMEAILSGESFRRVWEIAGRDLTSFRRRRLPFLLYPE